MELLIKRIKLLDNRAKEEVLRLDLFSTLIPYLLSTEIFKNNKDTKEFIDSLKLKKEVKWYVYKSRTQIVARISRELQKGNKETLSYNAKILKEHALPSDENDQNKKLVVDMLNKYSRNK